MVNRSLYGPIEGSSSPILEGGVTQPSVVSWLQGHGNSSALCQVVFPPHLRHLDEALIYDRGAGLDIGTGPMGVLKLSGQFGPPFFKFYWPVGQWFQSPTDRRRRFHNPPSQKHRTTLMILVYFLTFVLLHFIYNLLHSCV